MSGPKKPNPRRILTITALMVAGESVFLLPFILPRVFRPTILDVFDLTNLELGTAFSVYGVIAMAAYFLGGPLADRFPPRTMLAAALTLTAAGGLVLMTVPSLTTLVLLYAYWGITTIALFWAPLMRATREWGGENAQGRAFGLLDGGRGALAAGIGAVTVMLFAALLPEDEARASLSQKTEALTQVIVLMAAITCAAAGLIWLALPKTDMPRAREKPNASLRETVATMAQGLVQVLAMRTVWLQAAIILCAYVGFKATDDFSLYAHDVMGLDDVDAAEVGVMSLWVRPVAAVGAGFLADRFGAIVMTIVSFVLLAAGAAVLASGAIEPGMVTWFLLTVICASMGIFALRGLYYAIMGEGKVPLAFTGTAVGLVSVIGYTPDIFMGPLMGYLLDSSPGATGHAHVFMVVTGFALLGLVASVLFAKAAREEVARDAR